MSRHGRQLKKKMEGVDKSLSLLGAKEDEPEPTAEQAVLEPPAGTLPEELINNGFMRLKDEEHRNAIGVVWSGYGRNVSRFRNINDMAMVIYQGNAELFLIKNDNDELAYLFVDRIDRDTRTARVQIFDQTGRTIEREDHLQSFMPKVLEACKDVDGVDRLYVELKKGEDATPYLDAGVFIIKLDLERARLHQDSERREPVEASQSDSEEARPN